MGCPLVSETQASFPTCDFFPPYFTSSHLCPKGEAPQSRGGHRSSSSMLCLGLCYSVLLEAKQQYLAEVTPRAIFHGQERNVVHQEVHLLGNFAGSDHVGMVQPKHTESQMKTLSGDNRFQCNHVLCARDSFCSPQEYLLTQPAPTITQMHKIHTSGIQKPVISRNHVSKPRYRYSSSEFLYSPGSHYLCVCVYVLLYVGTDSPWPKCFTRIP